MNLSEKSHRVASGVKACSTARAYLPEVLEQIEFDCFSAEQVGEAERIARIIAEMYALPAESSVKIDGNYLNCSYVASVFEELENEDVVNVINKMRYAKNIKYLKSYIRTALYNTAIEK